jgi:hypothetical protein
MKAFGKYFIKFCYNFAAFKIWNIKKSLPLSITNAGIIVKNGYFEIFNAQLLDCQFNWRFSTFCQIFVHRFSTTY